MTLAEQRDWLRQRLGVITPIERWNSWGGASNPAQGPRPVPGTQPDWSPAPSNVLLNSAISTACDVVNRNANLSGSHIRYHDVAATSSNGPQAIELASLEGYPQRSIISIRKAWWLTSPGDTSTAFRLQPRVIGDLDRRGASYIADGPGTPFEFWVDGYTLFIHFGASAAGQVAYVAGDGLLAPLTDNDTFDPIPSSYDTCILNIALVELGKMLPNDTEMKARAVAFTPDAASGLNDIMSWFAGMSSDEMNPTLIFDARWYRRWGRRR
jgi:hypothetical protein